MALSHTSYVPSLDSEIGGCNGRKTRYKKLTMPTIATLCRLGPLMHNTGRNETADRPSKGTLLVRP